MSTLFVLALLSLPADAGSPGPVLQAWNALSAGGCDLSAIHIWTPIEARVLRNVPFALGGYTFSSPELSALYAADGDWYTPSGGKQVTLSAADEACVAKLKAREDELRAAGAFAMPEELEARMTREPAVFEAIRSWSQLGEGVSPYGDLRLRKEGDRWFFSAGYPGCEDDPEIGMECGGYFMECPTATDSPCVAMAAG